MIVEISSVSAGDKKLSAVTGASGRLFQSLEFDNDNLIQFHSTDLNQYQ